MCPETNKINQLIDELEQIIRNPHSGLPEEVFLLATRITPMVNVDLLIRNTKNQTLLTWRGGNYYSPGWHIPGGIIRYKENMSDRINHVARTELGVDVEFHAQPILISEIIRSPKILNRGHFISFLFECRIKECLLRQEGKENFRWFSECPENIIPVHNIYRDVIDRTKVKSEYLTDFGKNIIIFNGL